jgi:hypothetical protein
MQVIAEVYSALNQSFSQQIDQSIIYLCTDPMAKWLKSSYGFSSALYKFLNITAVRAVDMNR